MEQTRGQIWTKKNVTMLKSGFLQKEDEVMLLRTVILVFYKEEPENFTEAEVPSPALPDLPLFQNSAERPLPSLLTLRF